MVSYFNTVVYNCKVSLLAKAFFDGNRRTGIVAAGKFLHDNGHE
jgi:prophage maintenance system killer protein